MKEKIPERKSEKIFVGIVFAFLSMFFVSKKILLKHRKKEKNEKQAILIDFTWKLCRFI